MKLSTMKDSLFEQYIEGNREKVINIVIPPDINSMIAKQILSDLDNVYTLIRYDLSEIETAYQKSESIIRQCERTKAEGRNEDDRRKNASLYLEEYPAGENRTINMYEWNRLLRTRYEMVKALVQIIENKQQRLITMNGFLKIDKEIGSQYGGEYNA